MNTEYEDQCKIEKYIGDELSAQERADFEKKMEENPSLREEVELTRHIIAAFEKKGDEEVLDKLMNISSVDELKNILSAGSDANKFSLKSSRSLLGIISVAACILLIILIGMGPKYPSSELFATYFEPERLEVAPVRGDKEGTEEKWEILYTTTLNLLIEGETTDIRDNLIYLSSVPDFSYKEDARWMLALFYVKENERRNARKVLNRIIENKGDYSDEAKDLKQKLRMRKWF